MKTSLIALVCVGLTLVTLTGCAQPDGNSRLREKAEIEAESDQGQLDQKATEMENRLARQQRFFQGVAGTFIGQWKSEDSKVFEVRFVITPSLPAYTGDRIRSMDEITYDLTNLTLSIEESTTWRLKKGDDFSTGCNYALLKPRTDSGFIQASDQECPVTFVLSVGAASASKSGSVSELRENVSKKLLDGEIEQINDFKVEMRSIHRPGVETFNVRRTGF